MTIRRWQRDETLWLRAHVAQGSYVAYVSCEGEGAGPTHAGTTDSSEQTGDRGVAFGVVVTDS